MDGSRAPTYVRFATIRLIALLSAATAAPIGAHPVGCRQSLTGRLDRLRFRCHRCSWAAYAASRRPGLSRNSPHVSSCATAAAGRSAAWMCLSLHPAVMRPRSWIIVRRRCRGVNAASLAASGDISTSMSGYWLALVCRQCWCCEAHGCNCSAKNQPCDFCHVRPLRMSKQSDALLSTCRRLDCVSANAITRPSVCLFAK